MNMIDNAAAMRGNGQRERRLDWRRRVAASVGAVLLDDLRDTAA